MDENHILFIEGNYYATDFGAIETPVDGNMVYAFHKYWNAPDQGSIQYLINLREETGVPLWLGETGENSNPWFYATRTLAERNGISWNWWTHKKVQSVTSPASSPFAPGYQAVVDYWRGAGPRPSASAAQAALFGMATSLDLDRARINEGVLASLFDDDFNTTARPYREHTLPGRINLVDYDLGNQGVAYGDHDSWAVSGTPGGGNTGGAYRNDGVDIEPSTDPQGYGYNVGWVESLEWLQYTVTVEATGTYDIEVRVASGGGGGQFTLGADGETLGRVTVPGTGGWQSWRSVWLRGVELSEGEHVLRLSIRSGEFNLNTMRVTLAGGTATPEAPANETDLLGVFPNPARSRADLHFRLAEPAEVSLTVVDALGREVAVVLDREQPGGPHEVELDTSRLAPGVYTVRLETAAGRWIRRLVVVR